MHSFIKMPVLALVLTSAHCAFASNVLIVWDDAASRGIRDSKLGAPMAARALAIVHTCIYDAWAA